MTHLNLGSEPNDFKLRGVDNKMYTLNDFIDKEYIAIVFSCNHCPYVIASEREFKQLQEEFGQQGFQLLAINSNTANPKYPGDSFDNMVTRARDKSFNFPYLDDADQLLAKKYGAGRTPEIFLYDKNRKLVYQGRINNNPKEHDKITRHDLREAMLELIAGKEVSIPKTPALGCSIKFIED